MQALTFVLVALAALASAEYAETDDVIILTEDNFDSILAENQFILIEFYAPWCGHCKKLEPEYKVAATKLKDEGIRLAAVDATAHPSLGRRFDVSGYPTIKFFVNGQPQEYNGGRSADTIVSWLRKRTGPAAKKLEVDEIQAFSAKANVVVVGFFSSESDDSFKNFESIAQANDEFEFGVSFNKDAAIANGVASGEGVVLFKTFDEGKNVLDGDNLSAEEIKNFVTANSVPLVTPFTMEDAGKIFQNPLGVIALLFSNTPFEEYTTLAEKYRGKLLFVTSNDSYDRLNGYIGITTSDFPVFYILKTGNALLKYPLAGTPDAASVDAHVAGFLDGTVKPVFKSEPIPEDNNGPVKVVVGKNFDSLVLNENLNVFLEIYAPWCGHCKSLAPIWDQLGEEFASQSNVVIAKMDGTANEVDGINIKGFPTLQFFPAGQKTATSGVAYSGGRDFDSLKAYVSANAKGSAQSKDEL